MFKKYFIYILQCVLEYFLKEKTLKFKFQIDFKSKLSNKNDEIFKHQYKFCLANSGF